MCHSQEAMTVRQDGQNFDCRRKYESDVLLRSDPARHKNHKQENFVHCAGQSHAFPHIDRDIFLNL